MDIDLFEEKERNLTRYSYHSEDWYEYLDKSGIVEISQLRNKLNEWFNKFPSTSKAELRARFKSNFPSAFYELFIHELFSRAGFNLISHPDIPTSNKKPDFLAIGKGLEFYLEATVTTDSTSEEKGLENLTNTFYDVLNKLYSPNFLLCINELDFKSRRQPRSKKILKYFEDAISQIDPDIYSSALQLKGVEGIDPLIYEDNDVDISISLVPKDPVYRGAPGESIGIYPFRSIDGGPENSIKKAITKKSGRYGQLDRAYIICVNSLSDSGTKDVNVRNSLYGSLTNTFSTDPMKPYEKMARARDGFFVGHKGPQHTRVSAIFVTNVHPTSLHVSNHWFSEHPFTKNPLDLSKIGLAFDKVENGFLKNFKGKTIKEVLNIPDDWF